MAREMSPIFLSPAIINKFWMIQVRKIAEEKLQFCIERDLEYDGAKWYDFAHTILQKHVMDLTSKIYKRHLEIGGPELKFSSSVAFFSNFWSDRRTENSFFPSPGVG